MVVGAFRYSFPRRILPIERERLALAGTAHDLSQQKAQQAALQAALEQIESDRAQLERLNADLERLVAEKTADLSAAYARLEAQNRALRELDRLKSDFVSLVSHELRAPLTNIKGGLELVLSKAVRLPSTTREHLVLVQAEIERLSRFVETILDLSALEAGRLPLYPGAVRLRECGTTSATATGTSSPNCAPGLGNSPGTPTGAGR